MLFKKYDVFLSYAIEDKADVAAPLAEKLKAKGVKVYFAGDELDIGDDIGSQIHIGLRKSKFGAVILSPNYNRPWTLGEQFNLLDKEIQEKHLAIFPIWHKISYTEVLHNFPQLASRYGLSSTTGLDHIAEAISEKVVKWKRRKMGRVLKRTGIITGALCMMTAATQISSKTEIRKLPLAPKKIISALMQDHFIEVEQKLKNKLNQKINQFDGHREVRSSVLEAYEQFSKKSKSIINDYDFQTETGKFNGKEKVISAGVNINPYDYYGLMNPAVSLMQKIDSKHGDTLYLRRYAMINQEPVKFIIDSMVPEKNMMHVYVHIINNIRTAEVLFLRRTTTTRKNLQQLKFQGYKTDEEFVFEKDNKTWKLREQ